MSKTPEKRIMIYAARLACISDYVITGDMRIRSPEDLSREACVRSIRALGAFINNSEEANSRKSKEGNELWRQVSRECTGVKNADVLAVPYWSMNIVLKYYEMQKREIETALKLRELYEQGGSDLFAIADRNDVYCWTLKGWTNFEKRVPWYLVLAIKELVAAGAPFDIDDALQGMKAKKNELKESISQKHAKTASETLEGK